jgi:hypothetical protein
MQMSVLTESHNGRIGDRGFVAMVDVSSVILISMFAAYLQVLQEVHGNHAWHYCQIDLAQ